MSYIAYLIACIPKERLMARVIPNTLGLARLLEAEGFNVPAECVEAQIVYAADSIVQVRFTCNVYKEDLVKLGRALQKLGEQA